MPLPRYNTQGYGPRPVDLEDIYRTGTEMIQGLPPAIGFRTPAQQQYADGFFKTGWLGQQGPQAPDSHKRATQFTDHQIIKELYGRKGVEDVRQDKPPMEIEDILYRLFTGLPRRGLNQQSMYTEGDGTLEQLMRFLIR